MQAVILAGGKGRRLYPFTKEIPKPLVEVQGNPIIELLLKQMQACGVSEVIIALHHMADQIIDVVGDGSRLGLQVRYSHEEKELSTVAPLKLIDSLEDNFVVANGDILTDLNFDDLMNCHTCSKAELTVAVTKRCHDIDFGVIETDTNGSVVSFKEKPKSDYLVSCGIYVFSKTILAKIPTDVSFGFDDLMLLLIKQNIEINSYLFEKFWLDIGRPVDYEKAQTEYLKYFKDKN